MNQDGKYNVKQPQGDKPQGDTYLRYMSPIPLKLTNPTLSPERDEADTVGDTVGDTYRRHMSPLGPCPRGPRFLL
jgi:hypothetical protein